MVGCGAIGCEYMKIFSSMGISENSKGSIIIFDDDTIEYSNLNRQYLYKYIFFLKIYKKKLNIRCEDINKYKAETLKNTCLDYNKKLNILAFNHKLNEENPLDDNYIEKLDFIFSAVDNMEGRYFIQNLSILYDKFFFDAGTLGMNCNFYQFFPYKTNTLFDLPKNKIKKTPICTIHNHPFKPSHMIEWAKCAFFEIIYIEDIIKIKKVHENEIDSEKFLDLIKEDKRERIYVNLLIILFSKLIEKITKCYKRKETSQCF